MDGIFEHYLPAKYNLKWPVLKNYRLLSLEATINFLEENQSQKLSEDDWEWLLDFLDPNGLYPQSSLQENFFIVPASSAIRCTINPFNSTIDTSDLLADFVQLSKEKSGLSSEQALLRWVKKYGLLFSGPPKESSPFGSHGITDQIDISLQNFLVLENWLYEKFKVYVVSQYHLLYRAKEMAFIQNLCYLLFKNVPENIFTVTTHSQEFFSGLVDQNKPSFSASSKQIRDALENQFSYHLQNSRVGLDADEANHYCQAGSVSTPSGQLLSVLKIDPPNLYSALWLLVARQVMQKGEVGICSECGLAFLKARGWSKYCSDQCGERYRKKNLRKKN